MSNRKRLLLFLILLCLSAGLIQFARNLDHRKGQATPGPNEKTAEAQAIEAKVNDHLRNTDQQLKIQEEKVKLELSQTDKIPEVGDEVWPEFRKSKAELSAAAQGVDLSMDPREANAYQDLNQHPREFGTYNSAHSVIQNEEAHKEELADQQKQEAAEYARQFVENARRSGYQVTLDSHYVVVSVKKIQPTPQQIQVVDPNGTGSR